MEWIPICGWCSHECLYRNFPWAYYHVDSQRVCLPLPCSVNISPLHSHYTSLYNIVPPCLLLNSKELHTFSALIWTDKGLDTQSPWPTGALRLMLEFEEIQLGKSMKSPVKKNINFPKWSRIASHLSCLEIWSRSSCWTLRKTHIDLNHSFLMFSEPHGALPQPARSSNCWDIRSSQGPFWIRTPGPTKILSCLAAKPRYMVQSPSERWLNWLNQTKNWLFDG